MRFKRTRKIVEISLWIFFFLVGVIVIVGMVNKAQQQSQGLIVVPGRSQTGAQAGNQNVNVQGGGQAYRPVMRTGAS